VLGDLLDAPPGGARGWAELGLGGVESAKGVGEFALELMERRVHGRITLHGSRGAGLMLCPTGRASCAEGDHFVVGMSCLAGMSCRGPRVARPVIDSDQREDRCWLVWLDNFKRRVNTRAPRRRPVRQDQAIAVVRGRRGLLWPFRLRDRV